MTLHLLTPPAVEGVRLFSICCEAMTMDGVLSTLSLINQVP